MGRNSKDNSYARFESLIKISMRYQNYLGHARFNIFKRHFIQNVDNTLELLNKEHKRIIENEFFNEEADIYWWTKYYAKSTFYRKRFFAIKNFMEIYSQ